MLKNKCSVWKRIKFPTFWYNCYYFTRSDTYFIQLVTLLINHPSYLSVSMKWLFLFRRCTVKTHVIPSLKTWLYCVNTSPEWLASTISLLKLQLWIIITWTPHCLDTQTILNKAKRHLCSLSGEFILYLWLVCSMFLVYCLAVRLWIMFWCWHSGCDSFSFTEIPWWCVRISHDLFCHKHYTLSFIAFESTQLRVCCNMN